MNINNVKNTPGKLLQYLNCFHQHNVFNKLYIFLVVFLSSCYNAAEHTSDAWNLTDEELDSISFFTTHHYSQNYNFVVKADSIRIVCQAPDELPFDSVTIFKGEHIVVADIMSMPADTIDSVWVKIARDQVSQGWIREVTMLPSVQPDDPISQFIDTFSDVHLLIFLSFVIVVLSVYGLRFLSKRKARIVHFRDIPSFYPALLALLVSLAAVTYASIQLFGAETWRHFYYHPSLNPFALPVHLGFFLCLVWSIIIVTIATIDDVVRRLPFIEAALYLCGLAAVCAVDYILFSIFTLYYVGYPMFVGYVYYAITQYKRYSCFQYICGHCGEEIKERGFCPHCGKYND